MPAGNSGFEHPDDFGFGVGGASEKYIGDGLRQKTYTTGPIGNKKVVKNNGELPMYYTKDHHPAIIPREIYYRVKEIGRASCRERV